MALDQIHLYKLLKILFLPPKERRAALLKDIGEEKRRAIKKASGEKTGGGDFYKLFWVGAKSHVFDNADLHAIVEQCIANDKGKGRLYPLLRDGFLLWWNERRRWTNTPFHKGRSWKTQFSFPGLKATVKIENIMSVIDGLGEEHVVYPYFAEAPALTDESARLGLWLLTQALPDVPKLEIRILDVFRGQTYSIDRNPLKGTEEAEFRRLYESLMLERTRLQEGG